MSKRQDYETQTEQLVTPILEKYGFELYDFLVTGDVLDQPEYSIGTLQAANHSLDKLHLALAIAAALE